MENLYKLLSPDADCGLCRNIKEQIVEDLQDFIRHTRRLKETFRLTYPTVVHFTLSQDVC